MKLVVSLEVTVAFTVAPAKKGDLAGAREVFEKVEGTCITCHAKLRD